MAEVIEGFTSEGLALEAKTLVLTSLNQAEALEIGQIAYQIGLDRKLPIAIRVMMKEWVIFHASLPGSSPENDWWLTGKGNVVNATGRSTLHERVLIDEQGYDFHERTGLSKETHAVAGGGLALNVQGLGLTGILIVSGLTEVTDHLLAVEALTEYLARKGEQQ